MKQSLNPIRLSFRCILTVLMCVIVSSASAQIIKISGVGDAKTVNASGEPLEKGEAAKQAVVKAAINAVDKALQNQSDNIRQQFRERVGDDAERGDMVRKIINDIEVETIPVTQQKIVRALISGTFDLNELKDLLNRLDTINPKVQLSALEMAVFFTVRRSTDVTKSSATRKIVGDDKTNRESAAETVDEDSLTVDESSSQTNNQSVTSESVERADTISFESDAQLKEPFGTGLIGQFLDKGFEGVVDGSFFECSDQLDEDITSRGNPAPKTLRKVVKEIKDEGGIALIVVGSLDFSIPTKDALSGMYAVETTMSGKVMKLGRGRIPRTVAALEPQNFKGIGKTQEIAKKRALEAMAPLAADEIISKLKNNGVID